MFVTLLLAGCAQDPLTTPAGFCSSDTVQRWEPQSGEELSQFPDDALTVEDELSPTGLRVALDITETPWLLALPELIRPIARGLERRSGFARIGGVVLRFTRDLGEVPDPAALRLLDLSTDPPQDIPYAASLSDSGRQLVLQPLRPMRAGVQHAAVLTTGHVPADGDCVAPSALLQAMLSGEAVDERLGRVAADYAALPVRAGIEAADISAATVFTTHDDLSFVREVADVLSSQATDWLEAPTCDGRRCAGTFLAHDHRGEGDIVSSESAGTWELEVDLYLPAAGEEPAPLIVFGHGINSSRGEAAGAASRLVDELGVAIVAIDAMEHGGHPAADPDTMDALAFLGMALTPPKLDGLVLAQNFVQTSLDRLQLLALLRQHPDLDGDGQADLDMEQVGYLGISLGGLMGPGLMALGDDIDAAVLPVSGAHLGTFALENEYIVGLQGVLEDLAGDAAGWERALLVGQAAMDPADPAVYAAHVLEDRLGGREDGPDVLVPVCAFDGTVPVASGHFMARSLGIPHVPPVYEAVLGLEVSEPAPLSGNLEGATAGFFQLDRVSLSGGGVEASTHWDTPWSDEGTLMTRRFFSAWLEGGRAEIIDPYAELGTPPLGQ
ncbi:MAG: hypothetical protein ACI8S6_001615 [Myxococcota bacterium]|jgi:hypothetical protein